MCVPYPLQLGTRAMFIQVCLQMQEETWHVPRGCRPVPVGHMCPMCSRLAKDGFGSEQDADSQQEVFLCNGCGAIMFMCLRQRFSEAELLPHLVPATAMAPALREAVERKFSNSDADDDTEQPLLWAHIPVCKIRCARGADRGREPCWEGIVDVDDHDHDDDDHDDDHDDDESVRQTPIVWCHSDSLTHLANAHPFDPESGTTTLLPDVLGNYVVHVFLEPHDGIGSLRACRFAGDEACHRPRWNHEARRRLHSTNHDDDEDDEDQDDDEDEDEDDTIE